MNALKFILSLSKWEIRERLRDSTDRNRPFYQFCREMALSPFSFEATEFAKYRALKLGVATAEEITAAENLARERELAEFARLEEVERRKKKNGKGKADRAADLSPNVEE